MKTFKSFLEENILQLHGAPASAPTIHSIVDNITAIFPNSAHPEVHYNAIRDHLGGLEPSPLNLSFAVFKHLSSHPSLISSPEMTDMHKAPGGLSGLINSLTGEDIKYSPEALGIFDQHRNAFAGINDRIANKVRQTMTEAKFKFMDRWHDATEFFGSEIENVRGIFDPTDPSAPKERTTRTPPYLYTHPSDITKHLKGTVTPSTSHDRIWQAHPLGAIGSYLHKEIGMDAYVVHEHIDNVFDHVKKEEKIDNELGIRSSKGQHIQEGLHRELFNNTKLRRATMGWWRYKKLDLEEKWSELTRSIARAATKSAGFLSEEEDVDDDID